MRFRAQVHFTLVVSAILLAFSSSPPDGRTGAPFDGRCTDCHGGSTGISGETHIDGLPSNIQPNTQYTITVRLRRTAGNPPRGGFQLVAVQGNNTQAGSWSNGSGASFSNSGGRVYWKHAGAKNFSSDEITWSATWTSPPSAANNTIKMYAAGLFGNNAGGNSGDFMDLDFEQGTMPPPQAPTVTITNINNVKCFGESNGSMTANATGGSPPYSYSWSNGSNSSTNTNLGVGSYTVTVTDQNNLTASASASITSPPPLVSGTPTIRHVTCPKGNNGLITANPSGGTPPYTYLWSHGGITKTISNLTAGNYTVQVTDNFLCTTEATYQVTEPDTFVILSKISHPACPNDSTGKISVSVSGGTKPYRYKWSSNEPDTFILNKKAGAYEITVTDFNNCTIRQQFSITSKDTVPPSFSFKTNRIFLNSVGQMRLDTGLVIANFRDNCDHAPQIYFSIDSITCSHIGKLKLKVFASDASKNTSTDSIELDILDTLAPIIAGWNDTSFQRCDIVAPEIIATDNCGVASFSQDEGTKKGELFLPGINKQVFSAVDNSGNATKQIYCTQIINPLKLQLDSANTSKCNRDTLFAYIRLGHALNYQVALTHRMGGETTYYDRDTSLELTFRKPERVFIEATDSLNCRAAIDSNITYPNPIVELLSSTIIDPSSAVATDGSIVLEFNTEPDSLVFIHAQTQEPINNTGTNLGQGEYIIIVFKNECEFRFGPFTVKFNTGLKFPEIDLLDWYPNPFMEKLNLKLNTNEPITGYLYTMTGRKIGSKMLFPGEQIWELSHVPSGMFQLILCSKGFVANYRIIKI